VLDSAAHIGSFPGALLRTLVAHSATACIAREMLMARTASRLNGFALPIRGAANRDRTVACATRDFERRTRAGRVARAPVLPTPVPRGGLVQCGRAHGALTLHHQQHHQQPAAHSIALPEAFVVHAIVSPSHHARARHQCAVEKRSG
jgi:hypothetical protein